MRLWSADGTRMDSTDRVALVTGANTGIGRVTAEALARSGMHVFIACRSEDKARPVIQTAERAGWPGRMEFLPLDLGNLESIRACAQGFLARGLPLHLLINNAGLAGSHGLTESGFEVQFGVNHVGHFLLTDRLLTRIRESAPARIVTVASKAHYRAKGIDFDAVRRKTRSLSALDEYGVSKLANVLFSAELGRRLEGSGVTTYSLHPGVVASDVWRKVPWPFRPLIKLRMLSVEEGARTSIYCAMSPEVGNQTGRYYDECTPKEPSAAAKSRALAEELWDRSVAWTK